MSRCPCGHAALDHHGVDPAAGCLAVKSHKLPQCPCRLTCLQAAKAEGQSEVRAAVEAVLSGLDSIHDAMTVRAAMAAATR